MFLIGSAFSTFSLILNSRGLILVTFGALFGVLGSCWLLAGCKGCLGWPGWLARGIPGSRQCAQVVVKGSSRGPTVNYQTVSPHTINHLTVYPHTINMYICIHSDYTSDIQTVCPQSRSVAWWPSGGRRMTGSAQTQSGAGRFVSVPEAAYFPPR